MKKSIHSPAAGQPSTPHSLAFARGVKFRHAYVLAFIASGRSSSDASLQQTSHEILRNPQIAALPGAGARSASTLRRWVRHSRDPRAGLRERRALRRHRHAMANAINTPVRHVADLLGEKPSRTRRWHALGADRRTAGTGARP